MRTKRLRESDGLRTLAVVLDTGEEVLASLKEVATREKPTAAQVSAIGTFSDATLGASAGRRRKT
jgi:predicted DNA-binding protein with PD1-like motif